jgi:hypothetical protein
MGHKQFIDHEIETLLVLSLRRHSVLGGIVGIKPFHKLRNPLFNGSGWNVAQQVHHFDNI